MENVSGGRLAGDERDVGAVDAEIVQFAGGQLAEFSNRFTVAAPVVVRAYEVHFRLPLKTSWSLSTVEAYIFPICTKKERSFRIAALQYLHGI